MQAEERHLESFPGLTSQNMSEMPGTSKGVLVESAEQIKPQNSGAVGPSRPGWWVQVGSRKEGWVGVKRKAPGAGGGGRVPGPPRGGSREAGFGEQQVGGRWRQRLPCAPRTPRPRPWSCGSHRPGCGTAQTDHVSGKVRRQPETEEQTAVYTFPAAYLSRLASLVSGEAEPRRLLNWHLTVALWVGVTGSLFNTFTSLFLTGFSFGPDLNALSVLLVIGESNEFFDSRHFFFFFNFFFNVF